MASQNGFRLYVGDGGTAAARGQTVPPYRPFGDLDAPEFYRASPGLRDAVNVALALGQPLLVTGKPGTGKTQLASSVAHELGLNKLTFHAKTTSIARDLFYQYDALRHFNDSQVQKAAAPVDEYIAFDALGLAVLLSLPPAEADPFLPRELRGSGPVRSVVLIDEIDKAPRDFPNDILNEIEDMQFAVRELRRPSFVAEPAFRPIVIMTSNSEKDLPDAFLRRCVFFNIDPPDGQELQAIVERRLQLKSDFVPTKLKNAIQHFVDLRSTLKKEPATAEFLGWVKILNDMDIDIGALTPSQADIVAFSYTVLAKSKDDLDKLRSRIAAAP
jgi:MoxR-like ATPase